jgi:NAD(P)-dependent dehydrogenase (short-subunit alcohol dehydrogenase family)
LLRVNLAAPFALSRACLPLLAKSDDASIVFAGETHGVAPRAYWGGFAVAKSALSTLAAIWADELAERGPRVNVLVPGPIASPQRARSHPGEDPGAAAHGGRNRPRFPVLPGAGRPRRERENVAL